MCIIGPGEAKYSTERVFNCEPRVRRHTSSLQKKKNGCQSTRVTTTSTRHGPSTARSNSLQQSSKGNVFLEFNVIEGLKDLVEKKVGDEATFQGLGLTKDIFLVSATG
ncbi:hypothetical protein EYF80_040877 [Liparis tanakae]|uniref:Uncharacterized protein n=1 Tax=Liparis tanakae TaxID=230148 RepID=A0A4Z2G807_9TELE|nr:hypothetical protein EYF80_040877 [Liparis tanakae]